MKITVEKENITTFGNLKNGDVFIIPYKENPTDVFIKISKIYQISSSFMEILLEGCAECKDLDDCEANTYSFKSNQFCWFDSTDEVIKVEAELNVHK